MQRSSHGRGVDPAAGGEPHRTGVGKRVDGRAGGMEGAHDRQKLALEFGRGGVVGEAEDGGLRVEAGQLAPESLGQRRIRSCALARDLRLLVWSVPWGWSAWPRAYSALQPEVADAGPSRLAQNVELGAEAAFFRRSLPWRCWSA